MIPRIRARVGQATEPPEVAGKWYFEIEVGELGGGKFESLGQIGPWETEEIAHKKMSEACKLCCEEYEKKAHGKVSGRYVNMKTNQLKAWDNKEEPLPPKEGKKGKSTMVELVHELEALRALAGWSGSVYAIDTMIKEAKAGEYHDYKNQKYPCGKVESVDKLYKIALNASSEAVREKALQIRKEIMDGDYDEEADEEDKEAMRRDLPEKMWPILGLERKQ